MNKTMNNKPTNKSSAAPLAIIDGTHLILVADYFDASLARDGNSADEFIVPAIPLKDVSRFIGENYITCLDGDIETANAECDDDGNVVEEMKLVADDFIDDFGIIRPIKLSRDGKMSPATIRIRPIKYAHGVSTNWSDGDTCLDVNLPIWGDSDDDFDDINPSSDNACIYGDTHNDLLRDYGASLSRVEGKKCFEIRNAGSCLIADFLGVCGYLQVLILPLLDGEVMTSLQSNRSTSEDEMFQKGSEFMRMVLERSCLTDGCGVLLSDQMSHLDLTRHDCTLGVTIPVLKLKDLSGDLTNNKAKKLQQEAQSSTSNGNEPMDLDINSNTHQEKDNSQKDPPWLKTLEKTINHRISKKLNEAAQIEKSNQMCQELVTRGRYTLHKAVRCGFDNNKKNLCSEGVRDPQAVRIRYGMQPRSSMDSSCISVVMDLEVDVYLPEVLGKGERSKGSKDMETDETSCCSEMHEFHVSCVMSNNNQSALRASPRVSCEQVKTASGLVPTLRPGECVTILASVYFTHFNVSSSDHPSECSTVELSIQGFWVDGVSKAQGKPEEKPNRQGTILCVLQLPEEMFYLSPSNPPSSHGGRCINYKIDFVAKASNQDKYVPGAIFEHREPHTLTVDLTNCPSTLQDSKMWIDWVTSLNDGIGVNSHIDLFWKRGNPCLKLVIFGSNPEERAATVKLALRHLPESAKLISNEDLNKSMTQTTCSN